MDSEPKKFPGYFNSAPSTPSFNGDPLFQASQFHEFGPGTSFSYTPRHWQRPPIHNWYHPPPPDYQSHDSYRNPVPPQIPMEYPRASAPFSQERPTAMPIIDPMTGENQLEHMYLPEHHRSRLVEVRLWYREGQWSPFNTDGEKVYDRDFLLSLRHVATSNNVPENIPANIFMNNSSWSLGVIDRRLVRCLVNDKARNVSCPNKPSADLDVAADTSTPIERHRKTLAKASAEAIEARLSLPYREDQWSPSNPDGKKVYDRDFLLAVRYFPNSVKEPDSLPDNILKRMYELTDCNQQLQPKKKKKKVNDKKKHLESDEANAGVIEADVEKKTEEPYENVQAFFPGLPREKYETLIDLVQSLAVFTNKSLQDAVGSVFGKAVDETVFSFTRMIFCRELNGLAQLPVRYCIQKEKATELPPTVKEVLPQIPVKDCIEKKEKTEVPSSVREVLLQTIKLTSPIYNRRQETGGGDCGGGLPKVGGNVEVNEKCNRNFDTSPNLHTSTVGDGNVSLETQHKSPENLTMAPNLPSQPPTDTSLKLTPDSLEHWSRNIFGEYLNNRRTIQECEQEIKASIVASLHPQLVCDGCIRALEKSKVDRQRTGLLFAELIKSGTISLQDYCDGLKSALQVAADLSNHFSNVWNHVAELIVPVLCEGAITLKVLRPLMLNHVAKLLVCLTTLIIQERGPAFLQSSWNGIILSVPKPESQTISHSPEENYIKLNLQKSEILPEEDNYLPVTKDDSLKEDNKFEMLPKVDNSLEITKDDNPSVDGQKTPPSYEEIYHKLLAFFKSGTSHNDIIRWITANVDNRAEENQFIRTLTTSCFESSIVNNKLNIEMLQAKYVFLHHFLKKSVHELQSLYALQNLMNKLEHPPGLLRALCDKLYRDGIFSHGSFVAWGTSKDRAEQEGKGKVLKQLFSFFVQLKRDNEDSSSSEDF